MPFEKIFRRITDDREPASSVERALQTGLSVVAPLYGAGAWTNRLLHEFGVRPRTRLAAAVLSVGNLTVGGTGKTPFTLWLAGWLQAEGRKPAILSRGYGRGDEDALVVVHDGRKLCASPKTGGDEPFLLARRLGGVPVVACADRARGGRHALRKFGVDTLVLDDGLQHVALDRQCEIILVDATRPLSRLRMFPRGTLREPLSVLKRAHLIVLTRCDRDSASRFASALRRRCPSAAVVRTRLEPRALRVLGTGEAKPVSELKGARVVAACGLGNPAAFRATLERLGARVVKFVSMGDHAWPDRKALDSWEIARRRMRADYIVVTEKDAVKMKELGVLPPRLAALEVDLAFLSANEREAAERVLRARLNAGPVRGYLR